MEEKEEKLKPEYKQLKKIKKLHRYYGENNLEKKKKQKK